MYHKYFKELIITLAVQNKFDIKTLIKVNKKEREANRKCGIFVIKC